MKVPFDSLTLAAVVGELNGSIVGGHIQGVRQLNAHAVMLSIRIRGRTEALLVSCETEWARLHLTNPRSHAFEPAGPFTMSLRKYLEGGVIGSVGQVGFDRIVEMRVRVHGTERRLVLEAMGRHSNIVLVDPDGTVLGCAKQVGPGMSRVRPVLPGHAYADPPPPAGRVDPRSSEAETVIADCAEQDPEALCAWIRSTFIGMSPFLAREIAARVQHDPIATVWRAIFRNVPSGPWQATVIYGDSGEPVGAYPLRLTLVPNARQRAAPTVNDALNEAYGALMLSWSLNQRRQQAVSEITGAIRARDVRAQEARQRLTTVSEADRFRQHGDLLLTLEPDRDLSGGSVEVMDLYGDGGMIRIPVDPSKSLSENADALYRKARRLRAAAGWAAEQLTVLESELDTLQQALSIVTGAQDPAAIDQCVQDLAARGLIRRSRSQETGSRDTATRTATHDRGIRRVEGPDGWDMLVGVNAEGNDRLVRHHCAPHDFWFHVRSHTSGHVVVRNPNRKPDLPRHVAEAAALLAARHSKAKHSSYVTVDYTLGKHVRRPRGAAHGTVTYSHARTINVDPTAGEA